VALRKMGPTQSFPLEVLCCSGQVGAANLIDYISFYSKMRSSAMMAHAMEISTVGVSLL